ncbi:MAG: TIGR03663 family protein [Chloroflexota bacterium]|nr:TIGR03663 family protein [Dehalococcoidia bacterium]MDW8253645.1 TIGR03663 family protein [Chloroflexota bacterium]
MTRALLPLRSLSARGDAVDRVFSVVSVTWETLAYAGLTLVAAIMRFWDLGTRAMHHDESLHVLYSWYLYAGRGYQHDPMMHGPFQFHVNALIYFLFGDNDVTARLLYATFGTVLVLLPFFMRDLLGRGGALVTAVLLAFSPTMLYYSRFSRNDILMAVFTLLLALAAWRYIERKEVRWLYLGTLMMALGFSAKETHYITVAVFGSFFTAYWLWDLAGKGRLPRLEEVRDNRIFGVLILLGTLTLPLLAAFAKLTPLVSTDPTVIAFGPWVTTRAIFSQFVIAGICFVISTAVGLWWNRTVWPGYAALFWTVFVLLYSTFFTNLPGIGSGVWGSLAYWLDQHGVQRGNQPWYYYLLLLPLYEFLPLALAGAGIASLVRHRERLTPFVAFLFYWFVGSLVAYSWAGEKMPWLLVHVALPLIVLAGRSAGWWLEGVRWNSDVAWRAAAVVALFIAAAVVLAAGAAGLIQAAADLAPGWNGQALALIGIALLLVGAAVQVGAPFGGSGIVRAASGAIVLILLVLTMRAAWTVTYKHGDIATEMLIYTQTSPDIPRLYREIERLSLRATGGKELRISVDSTSGFTWPWAWYLRHYPNVDYPSYSGAAAPPAGQVVLIHANNVERMRPYLSDYTPGQRYRHRWWFPEDYKSAIEWVAAMGSPLAAQPGRPNSAFGFSDAVAASLSPTGLERLWQYFFNRDLGKPLGSEDGYFFVKSSLLAGEPLTAGPARPAQPDEYALALTPLQPSAAFGARGSGAGQLLEPRGIAVDGDGFIYVVDTGNHRVQKFDPSGRVVAQVGRRGTLDGEFTEPWGIAIAPDGTVWVADTWNHRLQQFTADLRFLRKFGEFGESVGQVTGNPGRFYGPRAIAFLDDGSLLVTDTGNKRIQRFRPDGQFLGAFGGAGAMLGQFQEPVGIAVAPDGTIFVADTWNRRIQRFDASLRPLGATPIRGWESTGILNKPYLAVDPSGNVIVSDPENHRLLRFSPEGQLLNVVGRFGAEPGSFNLPIGVAVGPDGALFVVDSNNARVQRFDPLP